MRKLLVSSFVSLDGVVESPMTWASRFFDDECTEYGLRKLDDVEFFLLGRVAYETFAPVWSTITGNAHIGRINGLKKLVASTTLGHCWQGARHSLKKTWVSCPSQATRNMRL
jgi:hypothetical protein